MSEDKKEIIEVRRFTSLKHTIEEIQRIYKAGFYADLIAIDREPSPNFGGINIGEYYELRIFKWTKG